MFKSKPAARTAAPFVVPSLSSASTDCATLEAKRAALSAKSEALERERLAVLEEIASGTPTKPNAARVAALLGDDVEPGGTMTSLRERLAEIARDTADISAARDVIAERIRAARSEASRTICADLRPEYDRRIGAFANALVAAQAAADDVEAMFDSLSIRDVAWVSHLPPLRAAWFLQTKATAYLAGVRAAGVSA